MLSNGYSAEYGHAIGGVINTVTRSGTNDIHGTGVLVFPQPHSERSRPIRFTSILPSGAIRQVPALADRLSRTSCSTSSMARSRAATSRF